MGLQVSARGDGDGEVAAATTWLPFPRWGWVAGAEVPAGSFSRDQSPSSAQKTLPRKCSDYPLPSPISPLLLSPRLLCTQLAL